MTREEILEQVQVLAFEASKVDDGQVLSAALLLIGKASRLPLRKKQAIVNMAFDIVKLGENGGH